MPPSAEPHPAALSPSVVYLIGRVDQGIRRELRKRLADLDLSVAEYTTLSVLRARPGLSNAELSRRALMAPQSMSEVIASLERRRLLGRAAGPDHARILRTELTAAGVAVLHRADPAVSEIQEAMLAGVTPRHRETVLASLRTCLANLSAGL